MLKVKSKLLFNNKLINQIKQKKILRVLAFTNADKTVYLIIVFIK